MFSPNSTEKKYKCWCGVRGMSLPSFYGLRNSHCFAGAPHRPARLPYPCAVTFALYDFDKKGKILPTDLKVMLSAVARENGVSLTDGQVDRLVGETFKQYDVNHDGAIDFDEYRSMCIQNPAMLKPLTINVAEIIAARS